MYSQFFIMKLGTYGIRVEVTTDSPYGAKKRQIKYGSRGSEIPENNGGFMVTHLQCHQEPKRK